MNHPHITHTHASTAFRYAIFANLLFSGFEMGVAFSAHSSSLLADAIHNFGDVLSLGLSWFAHYVLTKRATSLFSYGYKRLSIIAAFINSTILIGSSIWLAFSAIHHLYQPQHLQTWMMVGTALIGMLVNGWTARLFHHHDHDINQASAYWHLLYDALISASVVITGFIIYFTHWQWLDPLVGLGLMVFILWSTWKLWNNASRQMLDGVPAHINTHAIEHYLLNFPGVTSLHDLHIWGLSTQEIALTAHLVMPETTLQDEDHARIREAMDDQFGVQHVTLQVEKGYLSNPCGRSDSCC